MRLRHGRHTTRKGRAARPGPCFLYPMIRPKSPGTSNPFPFPTFGESEGGVGWFVDCHFDELLAPLYPLFRTSKPSDQ